MSTQIPEKKVIKLFKWCIVASVVNKYTQLGDMNGFGPETPNVLTPEQKRKQPRYVNLQKEKRCGKIKGEHVLTVL